MEHVTDRISVDFGDSPEAKQRAFEFKTRLLKRLHDRAPRIFAKKTPLRVSLEKDPIYEKRDPVDYVRRNGINSMPKAAGPEILKFLSSLSKDLGFSVVEEESVLSHTERKNKFCIYLIYNGMAYNRDSLVFSGSAKKCINFLKEYKQK